MTPAYPSDIRPLTTLRFFAAAWLLVYHFRAHLGFDLGHALPTIDLGSLGVDLFFVLSGFILAHVYVARVEARSYSHADFLINRIARVYPLHLATLAAMIALWAGARALGADLPDEAFKVSDLPAHLLMIHAWGATQTVGWNFPSWSISAEWFAYLLFPAFAAIWLAFRSRPLLGVAAAFALLIAVYVGSERIFQREFTELTAQVGALRIIPSFAIGVALYMLGRVRALPRGLAGPAAVLALGWLVAATSLRLETIWAWPGLGLAVYALAEMARAGQSGPLGGRIGVYLGEISYAMYMVHLPVDIAYFQVLSRLGVSEASPLAIRIAALLGVFIAVIITAALAHHIIERPARNAIRTWWAERQVKQT